MLKPPQFLVKLHIVSRVVMNAGWSMQQVIVCSREWACRLKNNIFGSQCTFKTQHNLGASISQIQSDTVSFFSILPVLLWTEKTLQPMLSFVPQQRFVDRNRKLPNLRCASAIKADGNGVSECTGHSEGLHGLVLPCFKICAAVGVFFSFKRVLY